MVLSPRRLAPLGHLSCPCAYPGVCVRGVAWVHPHPISLNSSHASDLPLPSVINAPSEPSLAKLGYMRPSPGGFSVLSRIAIAIQVKFVNLEQLGPVGRQNPTGATLGWISPPRAPGKSSLTTANQPPGRASQGH